MGKGGTRGKTSPWGQERQKGRERQKESETPGNRQRGREEKKEELGKVGRPTF